jgi:hypothetical protein
VWHVADITKNTFDASPGVKATCVSTADDRRGDAIMGDGEPHNPAAPVVIGLWAAGLSVFVFVGFKCQTAQKSKSLGNERKHRSVQGQGQGQQPQERAGASLLPK